MRQHGPALLRKAHEIEGRGALAFQVGRHRDQGADGDDAGAAHACHQDLERFIERLRTRFRIGRQCRFEVGQRQLDAGRFAQRTAQHRHEARTEAFDARIILVARRLLDLALAPEFGLERQDRQAVGLHAAVAAAFADGRVDHHAPRRIGEYGLARFVLLAPAALLGGAGLVVYQHRDAGDLAQHALDRIELVAVVHGDAVRQAHLRIVLGLVGHHHHLARALADHLLHDLRHRQAAVHRLAASHRNRIVVQNFIGDIGARRHRLTDCQRA